MRRALFTSLFFCLLFIAFGAFAQVKEKKPSITKELFGETEGKQVYRYTLKNSKGMMIKVINLGATLTDIFTPDRNNEMGNVVLGFDSLKQYVGKDNGRMGAIRGRVVNKIANSKFTIDGKEYNVILSKNGEPWGINKRVWNIEEMPGTKEVALKATYLSVDGEDGYPGNLNLTVTYTLTNDNEIKIYFKATTDKATPVVLTGHSYFNLSGGKDPKVLNTEMTILADKYLEVDKGPGNPTGNFLDVKGTPFDFTTPRKIGERIMDNDELLVKTKGYEVTYAFRNTTGKLALAATAYEPLSGRVLQLYTTEPGMIFYTANGLSEKVLGKGGKPFTKQGAFCLETQHFPDSPNQPKFPSVILRAGETFNSETCYKFSVRH